MNKNVKELLKLQEVDNNTREKEYRIRKLEKRKINIKKEIDQLRKNEKEQKERLKKLKEKSEKKNKEVDDLQDQIEKYRKRLDEGIISFKETEALEEKIEHSTRRMEELEDEAINIMMEIDRTKEEREKQKSETEAAIDTKNSKIEELENEIEDLTEALQVLEKEREKIAGKIPDRLIDQYERLRSASSDPVVQVKNGICQGCQMSVSKNTVKQARNSQGIATCENCSRILYIG